MKIQEYIDYIEEPINLMLHNKPTMVETIKKYLLAMYRDW